MICTMQNISIFAGTMEVFAAEPQSTSPANPKHNCSSDNDSADTTEWSYVYFGAYPQSEVKGGALNSAITEASYDSNGDAWVNGKKYRKIEKDGKTRYFKWERIKWKVLSNDGSTLFVVADKGLDCRENESKIKTWENSTIRSWLNKDFYSIAFSAKEQEAIIEQNVVNEKNPYYPSVDGNTTKDKIYLLSLGEVTNPSYGFCGVGERAGERETVCRSVYPSDYTNAVGTELRKKDGSCSWLLRTTGLNQGVYTTVYYGGFVNNYGEFSGNINEAYYALVPALHISLASDSWSLRDDRSSGEQPVTSSNPSTGSQKVNSSDKSVLDAFHFDMPKDSAYSQNDIHTGVSGVNTMSELVLTKAGTDNITYIYDNDKNKGIQDNINNTEAVTSSYHSDESLKPYNISETFDGDGDGKKELLAQLYLENTQKGGKILMSLSNLKTQKVLFQGKDTGGYVSTNADISSFEVEGLLSMCAGDFDGDGREELAVYTPNNLEETQSGSVPDTLQMKIYKLGVSSTELGNPQQTIEIAKVGDCQEWIYSHAHDKKQYFSIPYMQLTAGDADGDGIDDLLTVASFSSTFRNTPIKQASSWKQVLDPNTCFASVLDVYLGKKSGTLNQVVKKRMLVGKDNEYGYVLRNASVTIANVTGPHSNEIVIGGNYTRIAYNANTTENSNVASDRYVCTDKSDDASVIVGYVSANKLLSDDSKAASLSYNWTIQEDGYNPLHYYNGTKGTGKYGVGNGDYDAANEPVNLDGFAAYGYELPDTIALEGQLFNYDEDENKLVYNSFVIPDQASSGDKKSDVWLSSQTVGNVTNDAFGRETLYFTNCQKKSGKETYWNDIVSVWGVINADGTKGYQGKSMKDGKSSSAIHYSLNVCDIDEDSSYIKYEEGNTDVYYSNVRVLSVLQAAPVYSELGDDYVSDAETSYGTSKGQSEGTGHSHQVSAGIVAGFEQETSLFGLVKLGGFEMEMELSASMGWDFEKTAEKTFTTSYNTDGSTDVAVIYTVPYVRYNGEIFIPTYTLPTKEEYNAKLAFSEELLNNIKKYQDIKASVTGGTFANPKDGYNNGYTTTVTKDTYDKQIQLYYNYREWIDQTESQMEGFEGSKGLKWGQQIEGGWEDYFYCIPQTPIITSVSTDTYEEIAAGCEDLESLYGTALPSDYIAGDPTTYASSTENLLSRTKALENDNDKIETGRTNTEADNKDKDKDKIEADTNGFISSTAFSASSSSPSQTIEFNEENAKTTTVGGSFSMEATVNGGGVKGGISISTEHNASWSSSTTKGCEFSGTVPNLPDCPDYFTKEQYSNYNYGWKLVAYNAMVNGTKVPVVGYYTKFADRNKVPATAPCNLDVSEVKKDSITLTWNAGDRLADHYNIYRVSGGTKKEYQKVGTVLNNEKGIYNFTEGNLESGQTYSYVVCSGNADESVMSVHSNEITATTIIPDFDVVVKLEGIDSRNIYLAGQDQTLTANVTSENYPQFELDRYSWQVNDGTGWKELSNGANQNTYTWKTSYKMSGYQYRCVANVALDSQLYRVVSDVVTLKVQKANAEVKISTAKIAEGASDPSNQFGLASENGDTLEVTGVVTTDPATTDLSGRLVFLVAVSGDAVNVEEHPVTVEADGKATIQFNFTKAGNYTITARYEGNETVEAALSQNSASYYAYEASKQEDRKIGQAMEEKITPLAEVTVENAVDKKQEITEVKDTYNKLTNTQKDLVENEAKDKLEGAEDKLIASETANVINEIPDIVQKDENTKSKIQAARNAYNALTENQKEMVPAKEKQKLEAAEKAYNGLVAEEVVQKINTIGEVTLENAAQKKDLIDAAEEAYNALTDEQKVLVPVTVMKMLATAKENYQKAVESGGNTSSAAPSETQMPTPIETQMPAPSETQIPTPIETQIPALNETQMPAPSQPPAQTPHATAVPGVEKQIEDISGKLGVSKETASKIQKLTDEFNVGIETLLLTDKEIVAKKSEQDLKGSSYGKLQAKSGKVTSTQVKLTWVKVKGADGYLIYGTNCGKGNSYKLLKEIKKGSTKSYTQKKLEKGTFYRFVVCAYKWVDGKKITVSASKTIHIVTNGGKKGNVKDITINETKAAIKKGKTLTLKASEIKQKKPITNHRKICYESSNVKIATVTKNGIVKAKTKGKCRIYVYAQNGVCKKVTITVK